MSEFIKNPDFDSRGVDNLLTRGIAVWQGEQNIFEGENGRPLVREVIPI